MNVFAIAAIFKWLIDTLYKVIIMQCILSSSHPKQIKLMINYYVYNIRELLCLFPTVFLSPYAAWPYITCIRPFHDVQLHWYFKQSYDCDEVRGEPPVCV